MELGTEPDESLMAGAANGDRERMNMLVRRYASPLLTFIFRMTGDRHRSEELFQDVFLDVWKARMRYQYPLKFKSWLFGIAANKCRAEYRRESLWHAHEMEPAEEIFVSADRSPVEAAVCAETEVLIAEALDRLTSTQRAVLVMRVWNGLAYADIAATLTCSESTVRSHMFHSLTTLRKYLEPRLR
jgi:RNA polymerase sigma-70 factor (ECF subfamily)